MNAKRITLATLPQATAQEVFDQVARHLLTQRKRSLRDGISGACMYKAAGGLACAAGCLIADDEYDYSFESWSWEYLVANREDFPARHSSLITSLQVIHDSSFPTEWSYVLAVLANNEGLSPAVIEEFSARENA